MGRGFWVGGHSPYPATGPCGRSARLPGRWAPPLIRIWGSETEVPSFAHWRVPFGRRVLSSDPRPHPDTGGNVSHRRERCAGHGKLEQVYRGERRLSRVIWRGKSIFPSHAPTREQLAHPRLETQGLSRPTSVTIVSSYTLCLSIHREEHPRRTQYSSGCKNISHTHQLKKRRGKDRLHLR
jgi:hypothetical protein